MQALANSNPEAILNVTFGSGSREIRPRGNTRGLFKGSCGGKLPHRRAGISRPAEGGNAIGLIVTGYPWYSIKTPEHDAFLKAYQGKFNDYPRLGSIVGYQTIKAAAAILIKANSTDPEKMIVAAEGLSMPSPVPVRSPSARSIINQRSARSWARPRSRTARA